MPNPHAEVMQKLRSERSSEHSTVECFPRAIKTVAVVVAYVSLFSSSI